MARSGVGLDVGSTAVRAAEVTAGQPPVLLRAAQVPLQAGSVEHGEVRDPDAVGAAIRDLWSRGGFRTREATMGVGNQRVVVREVTVPALPPKEMRQTLPFQVQELIPIPVEDAVLDYDVLDEFEQDGAAMARLLVVAAQREMVDLLIRAALEAKVEPVGVDLVPFALIRAVGQDGGLGLEEGDRGGEAIIDVGSDVTNICVHERSLARFVRILPSGGGDVTRAMSDVLGVSPADAEGLKRGQVVDAAPPREQVESVLRDRVGGLVDEIRSSLDFYRAQTSEADISRVLVTGGGSKIPGLVELLGQRVGVPVGRGHAFGGVSVRLDLDEATVAEAEPLLAVALGLALPQE